VSCAISSKRFAAVFGEYSWKGYRFDPPQELYGLGVINFGVDLQRIEIIWILLNDSNRQLTDNERKKQFFHNP